MAIRLIGVAAGGLQPDTMPVQQKLFANARKIFSIKGGNRWIRLWMQLRNDMGIGLYQGDRWLKI